MDKKVIELERSLESTEIKRQTLERTLELTKKQMGDKITSLNDVIIAEKETRDMWIERIEKESKEHNKT